MVTLSKGGGACKTHTQIHRLQENVLLPERYTNGTVHMPPAQCPEDSFAKEEIHALYLEGWLPFWQKDVKQRPCEGDEDIKIGSYMVCSGKRGHSNLVKSWCGRIISSHDGTGGETDGMALISATLCEA